MREWLSRNPSTLVLAPRELVSMRSNGKSCRVSCVAGRVWITEPGNRNDTVLGPGQEVIVASRGTIVMEALRTATVRVEVRTAARESQRSLAPVRRLLTGLSA